MTGSMTGRLLSNRYQIAERIGIGGMAEVYKAQDTVLGRVVAVKVMLPQYAAEPSFTQRFRQEAAAAANLQSPYIVNVYDWGQDDGTYYIVMEFVRGSDLKTAINQRGAINQRKVAEIGSHVCQALNVAHHQDIIHRDIKPQNIMVQPDGNVKVMDFGIARAKNSVKTRTSSVLGTAHYISPEQAQGKELTAASDIYSLGVVLYEAATGQLPFDGPDAVSVALKQVNEEPPLPSDINPDIDPDLEDIIMMAMMKNPHDRFATANDMRVALNDYLAGRPVNFGSFGASAGAAETAVLTGGASAGAVAGAGAVYGAGAGISAGAGNGSTQVMPGGIAGPASGGGGTNYRSGGTRYNTGGRGNSGSGNGGGNKKIIAIVAALVAVVALAAVAAFAFLGNDEEETALVPNVVGQTLDQATRALEAEGFTIGSSEVAYDANVAAGLIIRQDPGASSEQPVGTAVNVVVSQGTEPVKVPDLTNLTAEEAKRKLAEVGLKYEAGTAQYSDSVAKDLVVSQEPLSGTKVDPGTTVVYILSLGSETVPVPNVEGQSEGAARTILENAEFKVTTGEVYSKDVPEGYVVSQTPKAEEKAKKGTSVYLEISKGPEIVTYTVSAIASGGGSVSPSSVTVDEGSNASFTVTANQGYAVKSIRDQKGNTYTLASGNTLTVGNVKENIEIYIEFEEIAPANNQTPTGSQTGNSGAAGSNASAASTSSTDEDA